MENKEQNKRTWDDDPQYFGSYLNMARLNIFNISNHLAKKFGLTVLDDEGKIAISFLGDKENKEYKTKQGLIYSNLTRYMPIAKVFDFEMLPKEEKDKSENNYGKDFNKLSDTLKIIFKELNEFRNDYSHYYSTEKQDKRKTEISSELNDFLILNFSRAVSYTKERFKEVFSDDDYKIASQTIVANGDNTITQDGIVFLTAMFLDRENAFQFINKIVGLKGTQTKEFKAKREVLLFFCVKLPHDKFVSENPEQAFSLDLINELNKCPKTLYNVITEEGKQLFRPTLETEQIKNVLQNSVPDTIDDYENYIEGITKKVRNENRFSYFALKYLDQKELFKNWRFQIDLGKIVLDEYYKQLNGKDEVRTVTENAKAFGKLQDLNDEETVLKKINTGENKTCFDQFAPHYNFDDKNNKIGISSKKEPIAKFITRNTDKKIKANLLQPLPEAFLSIHELPKIILLEYLEQGKTEQLINDFIKQNNPKIFNKEFIEAIKLKLNNLDVFHKRSRGRKQEHAYLTKDGKIDYKKINDLKNRKEKLNQILAEHNLNVKQIPTRILDYWLNIEDVQEKTAISGRIKLMKRDCMDRLKAIKKKNPPKIGEMATFLAKDVVDMIIGEEKKKKITSFYYDKMQECLALFADKEKKELFIQICNELKLNNETDGHPFLKNINLNDFRYTSDLYKKYAEEKRLYLENNFYKKGRNEKTKKDLTVVVLPHDRSKIPFSIRQLEKEKTSFDKWLQYVTKGKETTDKKKPVDLPVNLFDDEIKKLLKKELSKNNIEFDNNANTNELFKIWWSQCREDDVQKFYTAEREYTFEDEKLNFKINSKSKFEEYINPEFAEKIFTLKSKKREKENNTGKRLPPLKLKEVTKNITNKIANTEKKIRLIQEEDRLMLLMFEQLTKKELNVKLKNTDELLNEQIEIRENISEKLVFDDFGHLIEEKKSQKTIAKNIVETRKRKEYSVLKKYVFDRRLPELFEYFEEEDIPMEKIKLELNSYTKAKDIIFDLAFELEKFIIADNLQTILEINKKLNDEEKELKIKKLNINSDKYKAEKNKIIESIDNRKNIQHKPYLHWLLKNDLISEEEFKFMNMVRNTFSHNQFPQKKTMELFIRHWDKQNLAMQIAEVYNQKIVEIAAKCKDM